MKRWFRWFRKPEGMISPGGPYGPPIWEPTPPPRRTK